MAQQTEPAKQAQQAAHAKAASPKNAAAGGGAASAEGQANGDAETMQGRLEPGGFGPWMQGLVVNAPSWLVSMVFHMIVLLVLALWTMPQEVKQTFQNLVVTPNEDSEEIDEVEDFDTEELEEVEVTTEMVTVATEIVPQEMVISPADEMEAAAVSVELSEIGPELAPRNDLLAKVGTYAGQGLEGRGAGARGQLVRKRGGNGASEEAVNLALAWLAAHQMPDGGWSFNHCLSPMCQGKCSHAGTFAEARNGATAMALLPFLGAGQTQRAGKYQKTVYHGLNYLVRNIKVDQKGGSWHEKGGSMYSHGLASIALCEAYAMTKDRSLHAPAQASLNFICYAQDPVGGGWRYKPRQPGDTSVVGWQLMALKSGHMAYLQVPPTVIKKAFNYLDSVQGNSGATYGYTDPGDGAATSAIGLLCRMYLGWKKDNPALERGVQKISARGPSKGNMYYNYYATQVMHHWEGELWDKWNVEMRDYLVNSQDKDGHQRGSWFFDKGGDHGSERGGRLYCTSMAAMTLEVYYRHLPIYSSKSTEEDFPE